MAPRGRTRKRLGRMDAAVDAMAPLGFDERLVKITVKNLLKEYGGDEWWPFIEEYSYRELIDAILRAQDEDQTKTQKDVSSQDKRAEGPPLESTIVPSGALVDSTRNEQSTFSTGPLVDSTCNEQTAIGPSGALVDSTCKEQTAIGPSGTLVDFTCSEALNTVGETDFSEPVNAVGEPRDKDLCSNKQDIGSSEEFCPPPPERGRNRWNDIADCQPSIQKGIVNAACSDDGNYVNQVKRQSKSHIFAPPLTSSPCPVNCLNMCSGSQMQSKRNFPVSTLPPTSSSYRVSNLKMSSGSHVQSPRNSHVYTPPPKSSSCRVSNLKRSSEGQVQSPINTHVSTSPPTSSSCQVSNFKLSSGSQVQSPILARVSTPPPKFSLCRMSNFIMSSGSQVQSPILARVSTPPPKSSSCRMSNFIMSSGSQVQSPRNSHISAPPPTLSCAVSNLPSPVGHHLTTLPSSKPVSAQPPRRRFPCYGWIESDDEEDADGFI